MLALVLVVGFACVGAWGGIKYIQTFWLYRGYAAPVTPRYVWVGSGRARRRIAVLPGTLETIAFRSSALGGQSENVLVYLPPNYGRDTLARYPVLYLLHGVPGSPAQFVNVGEVVELSETLLAEHRIEPMILVMPTGGPNSFADEEWANQVRPHNAWETYVAGNLVDAIDRRFAADTSGHDRGIAGLSEGGYGSLNIAFHHVGEFDLIEAWSPYYYGDTGPQFFGDSRALWEYNSPAIEVSRVAKGLRANHDYIWIYTGTRDYATRKSRRFVAQLAQLGISSEYLLESGQHNWHLWRSMMAQSLTVASTYFSHGAGAEPHGLPSDHAGIAA